MTPPRLTATAPLVALMSVPFVALPAPAHAAADGAWLCVANGDIPIGIVTISGTSSDFVTTNTAWEPVENPSDGGGSLTVSGHAVTPADGPLVTEFEVTGLIEGDRLYWNNGFDAPMACSR